MSAGSIRRTVVGNYRLVDFLGAGGMGEVYRGIHRTTGRVVAIKVLTNGRDAFAERFRNEARIQSALSHPHIATLYEYFEDEDLCCIAMEYVSGMSLEQILQSRGRVEPRQALAWFGQVVDAVAYVHARGVIHRDLKSNNVKVDDTGAVKVLDFGIAKSGDSPKLTTEGSVVGTLHYVAPEQVKGQPASQASDIWALGVVLYELVTGRVPFSGESISNVMTRILRGTFDLPSQVVGTLPRNVEQIITTCLRVEPSQRFRSAADLLDAVRQAQTGESGIVSARTHLQLSPSAKLGASIAAVVAAVAFLGVTLVKRPSIPTSHAADSVVPPVHDSAPEVIPNTSQNAASSRDVVIKVFGEGSAQVFRDGRLLGATPVTLQAHVGEWISITLRRDGYTESRQRFQVVDGENEYTYMLNRTPSSTPPSFAGSL